MNNNNLFNYINENIIDGVIPMTETAAGSLIIDQSPRNKMRADLVNILIEDFKELYGEEYFDILLTKDGIVLAITNEETGKVVSLELKTTIKSLDFDPFFESYNYERELLAKAKKQNAAEEKKQRKIKIAEINRQEKLQLMNAAIVLKK